MSEKMKNIPKLRFPEFINDKEWKNIPLSQIGEIITGNTPSTTDLKNYGGDKLFVSPADISDKRYITTTKTTLSEKGFALTRFIKANSILFVCIGSTIGKVAQNKIDCATNQQINSIVPFSKYDNDFIYSSLENNSSKIALMAGNHAVPIINKTLFSTVLIACPLLVEQKKIADCLNSIDSLITAQNQKVELLKEHKNGLLQNLFPKDGEDIPKLRFPEFVNDKKWEKTTIGKIGSFYYGKSAPKWSLEEDALTPCVRYGELYTKFGTVITETYSRTNIDPKNLKFSKGGEILIPRVGEKPEDFGKCCCYLPLGNIAIGEMISVFETSQNPLFYTYYFRNLYKKFANVVEGQNVKNLYYIELEPLEIYRPSLEEQQKIADCLTSIDNEINLQIQKVESLKEHKKALLQQLFPSNEVNK